MATDQEVWESIIAPVDGSIISTHASYCGSVFVDRGIMTEPDLNLILGTTQEQMDLLKDLVDDVKRMPDSLGRDQAQTDIWRFLLIVEYDKDDVLGCRDYLVCKGKIVEILQWHVDNTNTRP